MDKPHQDKPPKMPTENYNYHHKLVDEWRTDLKPLNVDQPEGPSFKVYSLTPIFQGQDSYSKPLRLPYPCDAKQSTAQHSMA